ncbi:hypothetical protein BDW71DRAFT_206300 [Aspergillus fruticulosus]
MEDYAIRLTVPDTHLLVDGESNAPIPGSISISPATSTSASSLSPTCRPEIKVKLVRLVSPRRLSPPAPGKENGGKTLPWRRTTARVQPLPSQIPNAQSQTLAECIIWHAPDVSSGDFHGPKFNFSLPIPGNIPPTADTVLGSVSYTVTATVRLASSVSVQDSQPVRIRRVAPPEPVLHVRTYPGSPVVTELYIAPHPPDPERAGNKAQYSLRWRARSTIMPGARESEVKYVVAKEVRWQVDETVKRLSLARHGDGPNGQRIIYHRQHTHQLCQGGTAGRWMAGSGCTAQVRETGAGGLIEIPFQVRIPTAVDEIDALSYYSDHDYNHGDHRETLAITISHQLHLEVITGEDTFHRRTGDLVERRTCVKSYKAVFALPIRDAAEADLLTQLRAATGLPKYEDPHPAPPDYGRE